MCGRYTQKQKKAVVEKLHGVQKVVDDISASYNVCPGQDVAVIAGYEERRLGLLRWGFPPFRAGARAVINARAETVAQKPTFAPLLQKRRCLIVADGFYEWRQAEGRKQPMYIHLRDDMPFVFAGLWNTVAGQEGVDRNYCTIITTRANEMMSSIHHRMPVILTGSAVDAWLDPKYRNLDALLQPYPDDNMTCYPVSSAVNSPKNDGAELIEPVT
jgi:putative SOS response-associated peptidase YedK